MEAVGELAAALEDLKVRLSSLPFPANRTAYACWRRHGSLGLRWRG